MPPAPKSIADIEMAFSDDNVKQLYGQTKHLQNPELNQFYRTTYECDEFAYTVFASQRIIDIIGHYPIQTETKKSVR